MFPNSAASRFTENRFTLLISATPTANEAVVTTPIAASAPILRRLATPLIRRADAIPQRPAKR